MMPYHNACILLQEMDFEEKERRLQHSFPQFTYEEIYHALDAARGDYDLCASMLLETHEEAELQVGKALFWAMGALHPQTAALTASVACLLVPDLCHRGQ